jgi:uncharacterized protein YbjT (DUF2867 family)
MKALAVTGGTGFVGATLIDLAVTEGWRVRALARRAQPARDGVEWIAGALDDAAALAMLAEGADALIHIAGLTNAPDRAAFAAGNIEGTTAMLAAAEGAGFRRFVHVSSLAAREPRLSDYGWSKAEAENLVAASGLDWTMVRPPAVYGPGDKDQLDLFRMAKRGIVPLPPGGRISQIHVEDLARLLLAVATDDASIGRAYEADDGREAGWGHEDFARAIGDAVGKRIIPLPLPAALVRVGARIDRLARRSSAKLTPDRAAYFCHPDWVIDPAKRPPAELWMPQIETRHGLKATAAWYRAHGWL